MQPTAVVYLQCLASGLLTKLCKQTSELFKAYHVASAFSLGISCYVGVFLCVIHLYTYLYIFFKS